jgi:hypothetical protein
MNRRSFLAGLAAGIATLAVTTRLATSELRVAEVGYNLEGDYVMLMVSGTDHRGEPVEETILITAEELEEGDGSIEFPRFKHIEHVGIDNHMELGGRRTLHLRTPS